MNRGDIWYIDLGGSGGKRPVLVLTRQGVIDYLDKVTVVEITSRGKGYPTEVFIGAAGNLPSPSFVQTDNIHTLAKHRLMKYAGTLNRELLNEVGLKIILALGLEDAAEGLIG